jgi:formate dehydrogenase maturation protein FdhE
MEMFTSEKNGISHYKCNFCQVENRISRKKKRLHCNSQRKIKTWLTTDEMSLFMSFFGKRKTNVLAWTQVT